MTQNSTASASPAGESYLDPRWAQKRDQEVAELIEQLRGRLQQLSGLMVRVPELETRVESVGDLGLKVAAAQKSVTELQSKVGAHLEAGRDEMDLYRQELRRERDESLDLLRDLVAGDIERAMQVLESLGQAARDLQQGAAANGEHLQGWKLLQGEMAQARPDTEQRLTELQALHTEVQDALIQARTERDETAGWLGVERASAVEWLSHEQASLDEQFSAARAGLAQDRAALMGEVEAGQASLKKAQAAAAQVVANAGSEASRLMASAQAEALKVTQAAAKEAEKIREKAEKTRKEAHTETEQLLLAACEERRLMNEERLQHQVELSRVLQAASEVQTDAVRQQGQEFSAQVRGLSARVTSFTAWFQNASVFERLRHAPPVDDEHV